jgi:hypothetical protein
MPSATVALDCEKVAWLPFQVNGLQAPEGRSESVEVVLPSAHENTRFSRLRVFMPIQWQNHGRTLRVLWEVSIRAGPCGNPLI